LFNVVGVVSRIFLLTPFVFFWKQEVDRYDDLNKRLQDMGFTGVYKGRTGMATDGCAIFWRPARFQLLHEENIEFRELDLRDNVAQLCVLQMKNRNTKASKDEGATQASKSGYST
jgi:hypothetical protein